MKTTVQYRDGVFEVKSSGDGNGDGVNTLVDMILEHEQWAAGCPLLVDYTDLNFGPITVDEVKSIATYCGLNRERFGNSKLALIVSRDLAFGMIRMWEGFMEGTWDVTERLFRSRDEALMWLSP